MKALLEHVKKHPIAAPAWTLLAACFGAIAYMSDVWGLIEVLQALPRWLDSTIARVTLHLASCLVFLGFWVAVPAARSKSQGVQLNRKLHVISSLEMSDVHFVERAMSAGAVLLDCNALGAFADAGTLEHDLELARKRLLVVQQNAAYAASEPEYQAFFVVAKAARQAAGMETRYTVSEETVNENLRLIPTYVRSLSQIYKKPARP